MNRGTGILYVVATPIGNLADISDRARAILAEVDFIAAEDTRRTGMLLQHLGIQKPMVSFHDYNEERQTARLLDRLRTGETAALVSDAGTPLISDPGYRIVHEARQEKIQVIPIPGPSALIAALSVSGLPTDRFRFEGFLPSRAGARRKCLQALAEETATLVFYESSHRIGDSLRDMRDIFGETREAVVARELTKTFETILAGSLDEIVAIVEKDPDQSRGEFVIMVHGADAADAMLARDASATLLRVLLEELPVKQAASLAARYTGRPRNELYALALDIAREQKEKS